MVSPLLPAQSMSLVRYRLLLIHLLIHKSFRTFLTFLVLLRCTADKPGAPINFTFDEIRNTSVVVNWEPPEDDGGSEILNYILEKKDNKNDEIGWITVTSTLKGTSFPVTKLIEGKEYIFRVTAENKFGCGPPCVSEPLLAKNQFGEFTSFSRPVKALN